MLKRYAAAAALLLTACAPPPRGLPREGAPLTTTCTPGRSKRTLVGPDDPLAALRAAAEASPRSPLPADGSFETEELRYVGSARADANTIYPLAVLTVQAGEGCRFTRRLLVFDREGRYLGFYGPLAAAPSGVAGASVLFPFDAAAGNTLLMNGLRPPPKARLGGHLYWFQSATPS